MTPTKHYSWADWQLAENRVGLEPMTCDRCNQKATHLAIAEEKSAFDPEEEVLKRLCDEHWNKNTQKDWIKKWRKKTLTTPTQKGE